MAQRVARSRQGLCFGALALLVTPVAWAVPAMGDRVDDTGLQVVRWETTATGLDAVVAAPAMLSGRTLHETSFAVEVDTRPTDFTLTPLLGEQLDVAVVVATDPAATEDSSGDATRAAIVELTAGLPAGSRFAVIGDDPPRVLTPLTADRAAVSAALRTPGVAPATVGSALRTAATALAGARRPVVLMAGTGLPDGGYVPDPWPGGTPLYAARVGSVDGTAVPVRNSSGGFAMTRRPATIVGALDAIAADLSGQYRVTVPTLPADAHDVVVHVRSAEVDAAATIVVRRAVTTTATVAPPATPATGVLPVSPPASAARRADGTGRGGSSGRGLVAIAGIGLVVLAGLTVALARRPTRRGRPAPAAGQIVGTVLAPPPPGEIVVLRGSTAEKDQRHVGTVVATPADALREVVRRRATVLVIEPGTDDPWPLVRAVANHDRASGGYTRVVQVAANGTVIDLTGP
jgi:hypothetical protein